MTQTFLMPFSFKRERNLQSAKNAVAVARLTTHDYRNMGTREQQSLERFVCAAPKSLGKKKKLGNPVQFEANTLLFNEENRDAMTPYQSP